MFKQFMQDESGATAIEYALIAALLSIGIIVALRELRDNLKNTFTAVSDELSDANTKIDNGGG